VVLSDLDGTLLNNEHQISEYTKTVFQALHAANYLIIIATGRHHLDAMPIVETLGCPVYLITSNGARIHSPSKELLYSFDMESEAVKSIVSLNKDPEITTVLFKENVWLTSKENKKLNSFQTVMNYPYEVVDFDTIEDFAAIKLFFSHTDHQRLVDLNTIISKNNSYGLSSFFSLPICLECTDKSIDKSIAVLRILEKYNLTLQEAIAFGDGFNDEKMLFLARKGVIMNNAAESFKNKLPHLEVTLSNDDDGVAKYLFQKLLC
jgi:Cof subfamily protein (haloacid dehalogenase superfamily)